MLSTSAGPLVVADHVDAAAHGAGVEAVALLDQHHEVLEQPGDALDVVVAVERDLVAADVDRDRREGGLDGAQHLVALAEEQGHEVVAGDGDLDLGARHDGAKATGRPASPRRRSPPAPYAPGVDERPGHAGTVPSRHRTGSLRGDRTPGLAARLDAWLADARIEGSADARARERWLHAAAEADATFAGVLLDLAERRVAVAVRPPPGGDATTGASR